jgi:hypothetical protein
VKTEIIPFISQIRDRARNLMIREAYYGLSDQYDIRHGQMFILVYITTSVRSFDRLIHDCVGEFAEYHEHYPISTVTSHCNPPYTSETQQEKGTWIPRGLRAVDFNFSGTGAEAPGFDFRSELMREGWSKYMLGMMREHWAFERRKEEEKEKNKKKEEEEEREMEMEEGDESVRLTVEDMLEWMQIESR